MSGSRLQRWIDELQDTGGQQWALRLVALVAALGAVAAVAAEVGRWWPFGIVVVAALSAASGFRPDSHIAAGVMLVVVWHWLATVDRVDTVWLPVGTCCLLVYHAVIALTATFPIGGVVPPATLLQWLRRVGGGGIVTFAMWALVVLMDRREAPGNGLLTALALVVVAAAAVVLRSRSVDGPA